jgi:hypothetical protein
MRSKAITLYSFAVAIVLGIFLLTTTAEAKPLTQKQQIRILQKENAALRTQRDKARSKNLANIETVRRQGKIIKFYKKLTTDLNNGVPIEVPVYAKPFSEQIKSLTRQQLFDKYLVPLAEVWGCADMDLSDETGPGMQFADPCDWGDEEEPVEETDE